MRTRSPLVQALVGLAAFGVVTLLWSPGFATLRHSQAAETAPSVEASRLGRLDGPAVLLAAGDIATCEAPENATAALIDDEPGVVAALGDLAYERGGVAAFRDCYGPSWGRFVDRTRPAIGNHDARTPDAGGYFAFFGAAAGPAPQGYYSYDLGAWHVVVLNSNCTMVGGCGEGSPQLRWLVDDLAVTDQPNILAYWHHPRFSTGGHGDDRAVDMFWRVLSDAGASVVLSGHDHNYQRFVPLDRDGDAAAGGMTQFVVGSGGKGLRGFDEDRPTVGYRQDQQYGVLRLELQDCGYTHAFLPVDGGPPLDAGRVGATCRGATPAPSGD